MGWVLGAAVVAAIAWIAVLIGGRIVASDRLRVQAAEARALEAARPGARAEDPIDVGFGSQIEPRVEREPCPRCGGRFHVDTHEAPTVHAPGREPEVLRRVQTRCGGCGAERVTWFRIRPLVTSA